MKTTLVKLIIGIIGVAALCMLGQIVIAAEVPRMTKEELKKNLNNPDIIIVDVRTGNDWKASEFKIKGAVRENPSDFGSWSGKYPKNKTLVLYCG